MTTPQRWQEIDRMFAAEQNFRQSSVRFSDRAVAGYEKLRKEVESVLARAVSY